MTLQDDDAIAAAARGSGGLYITAANLEHIRNVLNQYFEAGRRHDEIERTILAVDCANLMANVLAQAEE
jgi:hypothetical protein